MFNVRSFGLTDIGRRRKQNEDAFLRNDEVKLFVVADGMGGHAAGEIASAEAVDTVYGMMKRGLVSLGPESEEFSDEKLSKARRLIEAAIQNATYMVFTMSEVDTGKSGMGTTISAAYIYKNLFVLGQVGDSRIYRIRGGIAEQLTEDHTLVGWQVRQGLITEDEAKVSPHRNVIIRSVGGRDYVEVDTCAVAIQKGDRFLLCSDGLHGYLEPEEIPDIAAFGGDKAVRAFIDLANERGGHDNITCILVEID
ncbi:MAG: serine/threonine-protein phosphatase [Myxococcales bacterium]|nr:serine/threonine-protein phosphatase [Myxococcales bacterium]